jgi:hypothetical protein
LTPFSAVAPASVPVLSDRCTKRKFQHHRKVGSGSGRLIQSKEIFSPMAEGNQNKPTGEELIRLTARCKAAG